MIVYLDASALVKQYVAESGSAEVNALIARAEADLSMTTLLHPFPEAFYAAYQEVHPLQAGWRARLGIYLIKEYLATMALFGNRYRSLDSLRALLDAYV